MAEPELQKYKEQDMKNARKLQQFIPHILLATILCLIFGSIFFLDFVHMFAVRNAPIVTGHIVAQKPIRQFLLKRVDFTIQIDGTNTEVHACTDRYLMYRNLKDVRFHYSGDPAREVFLFEYESNPIWMALMPSGLLLIAYLLLISSLKKTGIRKSLIRNDTFPP